MSIFIQTFHPETAEFLVLLEEGMAVTFLAAPLISGNPGDFCPWVLLLASGSSFLDKREGHCLQLCVPCSCPADLGGLALCWDPSTPNSSYSSFFQPCQDLLPAEKHRVPCCWQAFSPIACIRKGESSEDDTLVLHAVGSVTAELFAVPQVLDA